MKQSALVLSLLTLIVSFPCISLANEKARVSVQLNENAPWNRECHAFTSEADFVSRASVYCLKQSNTRACHKSASTAFARCGYSSDYVKLSKRMHAKLLVVWALAGAQKGSAVMDRS